MIVIYIKVKIASENFWEYLFNIKNNLELKFYYYVLIGFIHQEFMFRTEIKSNK